MIAPRKPLQELERLKALADYAVLDTLSEPEFDDITLLASQICEVPIALISLIDADRQWFKSKLGIEACETSRDISFCGHAIHQNTLFEINNALEDSRFFNNPLVENAPNIRFYAGMPLMTKDGFALGTLCVIDQQPKVLSQQQKNALAALARQIVKLLESRRDFKKMALLTEQVEKKSAFNAALLHCTEACIFSFSNDGFLQKINTAGERLLGYTPAEVEGVATLATFLNPTELQQRAESVQITLESAKNAIDVVMACEKINKTQSQNLQNVETQHCENQNQTWTYQHKNHSQIPVTLTVSAIFHEAQTIGFVAIAQDITQQKQAEFKVRSHREAMQALNEIASDSKAKNYQEQISLGLKVACDYLGMMFGVLSQVQADVSEIKAQYSPENTLFEGLSYPISNTYCALAMASTEVVFAQNIEKSSYAQSKCYELLGYQSFIGQPLMIDGTLYGTLIFYNYQPKVAPFESVEIEFVKLLSRWVMNIIRRNQLLEKINLVNDRVNLALNGADLALWDLDLKTQKAVFNDRWAQMLGYELDELPHELNTWVRLLHPEDAEAALQKVSAYLAGETAELNIEFRMQHKAGHAIWVQDRGRVVERDAFGMPTRMVGTHLDITERKRAEDEIRLLAFYDVLTNLPNRRLLIDRLEHALVTSARSKQFGALIFIDLDNFKTLNDTSGHDKGDALLKRVATRLLSCLRDGDTVARFGGDEFVVMLDGLDTQESNAIHQVESVGGKIIASLNQPYDIGGQHYFSSPTLGATLFNGQTDNVDNSLKRADIAMYQAKNAGKNCLRFFDQHIQSNLLNKTKLAEDLRQAIDKKQFILHYQPQINVNGRITGAEALIRWHHPERGLVSPLEFIPLAEETGLITQLGSWVIETGCKQLVAWMEDPVASHYNLSINVSARQFQQPDFVNQVLSILEKTGANPKNLKLELTESMLVDDVDDVITKMSLLQLKGVSFSLDDFGTGFSSLSLLKLLPLNQLKIDKSFVRDVLTDSNDAVIARTIVALAKSLGLTVIAEGVEMEGQRDFLSENGCNDYQGYLFSRPLTIEAFDAYRQTLVNQDAEMKTLWEKAFLNNTVKQYSLFL